MKQVFWWFRDQKRNQLLSSKDLHAAWSIQHWAAQLNENINIMLGKAWTESLLKFSGVKTSLAYLMWDPHTRITIIRCMRQHYHWIQDYSLHLNIKTLRIRCARGDITPIIFMGSLTHLNSTIHIMFVYLHTLVQGKDQHHQCQKAISFENIWQIFLVSIKIKPLESVPTFWSKTCKGSWQHYSEENIWQNK